MKHPYCLLCGKKKKPLEGLYGSDCISKIEGKTIGDIIPIKLSNSRMRMISKDQDTPEIILASLMLDPSIDLNFKRIVAMNPKTPEHILDYYIDNVNDPESKQVIYANIKCPRKYIDEFIDNDYDKLKYRNIVYFAFQNASVEQKLTLMKKDNWYYNYAIRKGVISDEIVDLVLENGELYQKDLLAVRSDLSNEMIQKLLNQKQDRINNHLIANSNCPVDYLNKIYFEANEIEKEIMTFHMSSNAKIPLNILEDVIQLGMMNHSLTFWGHDLIQHPNLTEELHTILLVHTNRYSLKKGLRPDTTFKNLLLIEELIGMDGYLKQTDLLKKVKAHPNYKHNAT